MLGSALPVAEYQGRKKLFLGLRFHFLGASNIDNMANSAERNLELAQYNGETKRWNFDKYVKVHME